MFLLEALYSVKGWRLPRLVAVAVFAFYGVWLFASLAMRQTVLPPFANVDEPLNFMSPIFILLRFAAAFSTIILFAEFTRCFYRIWTSDQLLAGRLRFGLFGLGTLFALLNRLFVLAHIGTILFAPHEVSASVLAVEKTINLIATVFFLGGCLPPFIMERLAHAIVYLDQQRAILEAFRCCGQCSAMPLRLCWPYPIGALGKSQPMSCIGSMIDVLDRLWLLDSMPSPNNPTLSDIKSIRDPVSERVT